MYLLTGIVLKLLTIFSLSKVVNEIDSTSYNSLISRWICPLVSRSIFRLICDGFISSVIVFLEMPPTTVTEMLPIDTFVLFQCVNKMGL